MATGDCKCSNNKDATRTETDCTKNSDKKEPEADLEVIVSQTENFYCSKQNISLLMRRKSSPFKDISFFLIKI